MAKNNPYTKAVKEQEKMLLGVIGPSGSGKTWTSLLMATRIAEKDGGRIAFIDTEGRAARKYADDFDFDVLDLSNDYNPRKYINAIEAAEQNGYSVLIIDSFSHAWNGAGGVLEVVDRAGKKMGGNDFAGWSEGRPLQNQLVSRIINANIHIIGCMRAKTDWVLQEDKRGKMVPVKVGTTSVQSSEFEYEFDVVFMMDMDHTLTPTKSRCKGVNIEEPYTDVDTITDTLYAWANSGVEKPKPAETPFSQLPPDQAKQLLVKTLDELRLETDKALKGLGITKFSDFHKPYPVLEQQLKRIAKGGITNVTQFMRAVQDQVAQLSKSEVERLAGAKLSDITDYDAALQRVTQTFEQEMNNTPPAQPKNQQPPEIKPDPDPAKRLTVTAIERQSKQITILHTEELPNKTFRLYGRDKLRELGEGWGKWVKLLDSIGTKIDVPQPIHITDFSPRDGKDYYEVAAITADPLDYTDPEPSAEADDTPVADMNDIPF